MFLSDFLIYLFNLSLDFVFRYAVMFRSSIEHLFSRFIYGFHHIAIDVVLKFQFCHKFLSIKEGLTLASPSIREIR